MNDSYVEVLVKRQTKPVHTAIKLGMVIVTALFALAAVIFSWLLAIPAVILLIVDGIFLPRLALEFEYLYVSGELTIDKIMGKTKRKNCFAVEMEKVECVAPEGSDKLLDYRNMKCVEQDYTSRKEGTKPYICIFHGDKELWRVKFEPNVKMVEMMRQTSPRKVTI